MELATGALGTLLPKLAQLLKDEYNLHKGAKKNIEFLATELECIQAALRNVGEVPPEQLSELVKIWVRDARELSYDMEDIVDTFLVRVQGPEPPSKKSSKRFVKKMLDFVTKAKTRHEIGQDIEDIKERVKELAARHDRYKPDGFTPVKTLVDPRISSLYTKATDLVGIDEAREELIMRLTKRDELSVHQQQRIFSIVGFGGLGKTTLSKLVYDKLEGQFDCTAFVPVGQNPDLKKVFKDILIDLRMHSDLEILDERQLINKLREFLANKRYFIVMDDVWDIKSWRIIKNALVANSLGSKIVITTRKHDVAEEVGCSYELNPLTHESSKILFYGRIFGSADQCPSQFSEVSEKILKKCGGVPLAIVTTSSLLANKSKDIKVWNEVCDSIGYGLGGNHDMENMRKILSLSYYDLPSQLKTCLLYLSIFPEDYEIGKERLIWRWIAEDIVQHAGEGSQSVFELGESYFNELLNRSLIEVKYTVEDETTQLYCHVHDMVLELICSLSREENFVTTVLGESRQRTRPPSGSMKVRRLSLQNTTTWPRIDTSKLRSLNIFSSSIINSMSSLSCCHLLRVLDLEGCNIKDSPSLRFVGNLFHLRYLRLARIDYGNELQLPVEIGKLQFLQTLDLHESGICKLPSSIVGLSQLICLLVEGTRLPNEFRRLTSLKHLGYVSVDSACMAEELGHLTQLRTLRVMLKKDKDGRWDESLCTALVRSLGKLHKMEELRVVSYDVEADLAGSVECLGNLRDLNIVFTTFLPTWICPASVPLLSNLHIMMAQARTDDIRVLGMLQSLRSLYVRVTGDDILVLERFVVSHDAFPCAMRCLLSGNFSMVPSTFQPGAMPRLEEFYFCIRFEEFAGGGKFTIDDLALGHLPSLRSVYFCLSGKQDVNEEVVMEVEEKLRHEADVHPNHPHIEIRIF